MSDSACYISFFDGRKELGEYDGWKGGGIR